MYNSIVNLNRQKKEFNVHARAKKVPKQIPTSNSILKAPDVAPTVLRAVAVPVPVLVAETLVPVAVPAPVPVPAAVADGTALHCSANACILCPISGFADNQQSVH